VRIILRCSVPTSGQLRRALRLDREAVAIASKRSPCFSEELLESYALDLLPGSEVAKINNHCRSCKQCRAHLDMHEVCMYSVKSSLGRPRSLRDIAASSYNPLAGFRLGRWDGNSVVESFGSITMTRLITGVAASVVLIGALELGPNMRGGNEVQFMPLPLPTDEIATVSAFRELIGAPMPSLPAELPDTLSFETGSTTDQPAVQSRSVQGLFATLIGPRRPFVPPMKVSVARAEKPPTIDPPASMSRAGLSFPSLPGQLPSLRPPAKRGVKRLFSAVGAPFRRFGSMVAGNNDRSGM
jgi:hypothetical protein